MKKVLLTALAALLVLIIVACAEVTPPPQTDETQRTTIPTQTQCDHYDMDVDDRCDECGEALIWETEPAPTQTQPDHGTVTMHLHAQYTLGAYSSGTTTMNLYDSYVVTVESVVDTSAVGQGEQRIEKTGTWTYNGAEDTYTLDFGMEQYILRKNDQGLFSLQYSFVMKGQTGGHQDISVILLETKTE